MAVSSDYFLSESVNRLPMKMAEKRRLVQIGEDLQTLSQEDIDFIMRKDTTEAQCQQRMISARHRLPLTTSP